MDRSGERHGPGRPGNRLRASHRALWCWRAAQRPFQYPGDLRRPGRQGSPLHAADATAKSTARFHRIEIPGANHNYCTTQRSPGSRQVAAWDAAGRDDDRLGQCTEPCGSAREAQLTEAGQRQVGAAYIDAFFRRCPTGEKRFDAMVTGRRHLMAHIAPVDVTAGRP